MREYEVEVIWTDDHVNTILRNIVDSIHQCRIPVVTGDVTQIITVIVDTNDRIERSGDVVAHLRRRWGSSKAQNGLFRLWIADIRFGSHDYAGINHINTVYLNEPVEQDSPAVEVVTDGLIVVSSIDVDDIRRRVLGSQRCKIVEKSEDASVHEIKRLIGEMWKRRRQQ